jgi:hypothetical protein
MDQEDDEPTTFDWILAGEADLEYRKEVGSGGGGVVHEVASFLFPPTRLMVAI